MAISSYFSVMLNQISQDYVGVEKRTPCLGDHLIAARTGYTHHGIYIGDDEVIHYSGFHDGLNSGPIIKTSLQEFANGNHVMVKVLPKRKYDPKESISRAFSKLGEDKYNLVLNNCEHFVNWCIHGIATSKQVEEAAHLVCYPTLISNLTSVKVPSTILRSTSPIVANQSKVALMPTISKSAVQVVASKSVEVTSNSIASGLTTAASIGLVTFTGGAALPILVPIATVVAIGSCIDSVWDWFAD